MKNILRSKTWTAVAIGFVFLMLAGLIALAAAFYYRLDFLSEQTVFLEGEYSIDGGEWKKIDNSLPIADRFHKIVFKGKIDADILDSFDNINISAKNVWYTLSAPGGKTIDKYVYLDKQQLDEAYETVREYLISDGMMNDPMLNREYFESNYNADTGFGSYMPNTPGYITQTIFTESLKSSGVTDDTELVLEVTSPYKINELGFSDSFGVTLSDSNGAYLQFFFEALPLVLLSVLVCFFGIFLFPIAGFILGKIDYRYLAYGALCFFWGLFMIGQEISGYLNLWIHEPTVCMVIVVMLNYLFTITVLFYLKSNLERSFTRAIANVTATVYIIMVVAALILHFSGVIDLYATSPNIFIYTLLCTVTITVLLILESRHSRQAFTVLVAWTPLTISVILDAVNHYLAFSNVRFYVIGLAITMIYQIVRLILDLRKQYKEAIRYQQMQKELYEAKVSVMVSQIQPHFMYNALTSIAMMCQIDPDRAQEATVTFAKYLRGNMDSLKQTKPIPFEQELEHLKKYLYIEKLRFGKKLNIEYDIQATDFTLPQLSIQPLVENAVKHGVGMKKKGGTVTISTRETDGAFEVTIADDGVGFDASAAVKDDGRSHVGMENTKKRLRDMCGGEVIITSETGKGTVAKIVIPKEKDK